jgi:hypothetical protein
MQRRGGRIGTFGLIGTVVVLTMTAGCSGRNGAPRRWTDEPGYSPGQSRVARKPVNDRPTSTKPFFLGGYAGASY